MTKTVSNDALGLAQLAKATADEIDRKVAEYGFDPSGAFRARIRKALQKSVGVTDEIESLRSLVDMLNIVRGETSATEAEIARVQSGGQLEKAASGSQGGIRVTTGSNSSQPPINLELHLHQPLSPVINVPDGKQQRKIIRHVDEDTVEITSGDDYDASRMKQQLPKGS